MSVQGKITVDTWRGQYASVMWWKSADEKVTAEAPWLWLAMWLAYRKARKKGWL